MSETFVLSATLTADAVVTKAELTTETKEQE